MSSPQPNFLIIGAMKCATSTLHEQLARLPGIQMSEPKEICFFSDDENYANGWGWYQEHFDDAPEVRWRGESSTHYTKLPTHPNTVSRIREWLPADTKFLYLMRDPVDRIVSQWVHHWTQRELTCSLSDAVRKHEHLIAYSMYARQLEPYLESFGPSQVLPIFFSRLVADPQKEFERVCKFLGYDRPVAWQQDSDRQNTSAERMRSSRIRDALVYAPGINQVRKRLPQSWRDAAKQFWQMKNRPRLSDKDRQYVVEKLTPDVRRLGEWIGLPDLSCDNFDKLTREASFTLEKFPCKAPTTVVA